MAKRKRTTLHDVAAAAGVSAMSVSKALNNKGGLSPKTTRHILKVARQLHYQPNMVAKSLRVDETKTLGVVLSDSSEMVVSKVLRGIADRAEEQGYNIIISNTYSDRLKERHAVQTLISQRIDGLLIIASTLTSEEDSQWLKAWGLPTILLMRESMHTALDSVMNDNYDGGYQLAHHLIRQGCRQLGFLPLTSISQSGRNRLAGARLAMEENGVSYDESRVLYTLPTIQSGYENAKKLLDEKPLCDAVVCGCDLIAIGAVEALQETGIQVPGQIRICGYDDIELAGYLRVPLTTMRQPLYEIGQKGVELFLERIKNPGMPMQRVVLRSTLIVRESSVPKGHISIHTGE